MAVLNITSQISVQHQQFLTRYAQATGETVADVINELLGEWIECVGMTRLEFIDMKRSKEIRPNNLVTIR